MANTSGNTRSKAAAAFLAEQVFTIYLSLGPTRSLEKLQTITPKFGIKKIPRTTLHQWSTRYEWQRRVRDLDEETIRAGTVESVKRVQEMNEQQAVIGGMGVQVAAIALDRIRRQLTMAEPCDKCGIEPTELDSNDVVRLMDSFAKWQRLSLGEVTDRKEIAITVWNIVIKEIVQLFLAVNLYEDPEGRKREMMVGIDSVIGRHLESLTGGE